MPNHLRTGLIALVLLVATFLRLWQISDHFEFLADQGSAGVVIYESWRDKTLPLVGPTMSTGQRPGPAYYYLIALPLILSGFHPVAPAIFFSLLGVVSVYLLFVIGERLFGSLAGISAAFIYAVSPLIVVQNRAMWNPTLIPFFVILLIFALVKIILDKKYLYWSLVGGILAVLLQLHYSNIFTLIWTFGLSGYLWFMRQKSDKWKLFAWWCAGLFVFGLVFWPFLVYEYNHAFVDVRELILLVVMPAKTSDAGPTWWWNYFDVTSRLFRLIVPVQNQTWLFVIGVLVSLVLWVKSISRWVKLFILWFISGALFASFYGRSVYDHYLLYLYPLPFLLFGSLISRLTKLGNKKLLLLGLVAVAGFNLLKTDLLAIGHRDYAQTQAVAQNIIKLAKGQPFSFTIVSSRSFSDYHYRFFFTLWDDKPMPITSREYGALFLICESEQCPDGTELVRRAVIDVMCFDHHCRGEYPKLFLDDFRFQESTRVERAVVYRFTRK